MPGESPSEPLLQLDKRAISRACLAHAGRELSRTGVQPSLTSVGRLLDISQPMASRVSGGERALSLDTIVNYAARIGKDVGALFLELAELVAADQGVAPVGSEAPGPADVLDQAFEAARTLKEMIWRRPEGAAWRAEPLYEAAVARACGLCRDAQAPLVALALCFEHGGRYSVLAGRAGEAPDAPPVAVVSRTAPANLVAALDRCWQASGAVQVAREAVLIRPGAGGDAAALAFWRELTGSPAGLEGTKLRVYVEPVARGPHGPQTPGRPYAVSAAFLFEFRYRPPENVRRAMYLMGGIFHEIHSRQLRESGAGLSEEYRLPLTTRRHA